MGGSGEVGRHRDAPILHTFPPSLFPVKEGGPGLEEPGLVAGGYWLRRVGGPRGSGLAKVNEASPGVQPWGARCPSTELGRRFLAHGGDGVATSGLWGGS